MCGQKQAKTLHSQLLLLALLLAFGALSAGCDILLSLVGDEKGGGDSEVCSVAEACCVELNEASAYNKVIERAGVRDWPNHCPSWNARPQQECNELLDAVKVQKEQLEKDHPVFDYPKCAP